MVVRAGLGAAKWDFSGIGLTAREGLRPGKPSRATSTTSSSERALDPETPTNSRQPEGRVDLAVELAAGMQRRGMIETRTTYWACYLGCG